MDSKIAPNRNVLIASGVSTTDALRLCEIFDFISNLVVHNKYDQSTQFHLKYFTDASISNCPYLRWRNAKFSFIIKKVLIFSLKKNL
jgi:hypothetical protein